MCSTCVCPAVTKNGWPQFEHSRSPGLWFDVLCLPYRQVIQHHQLSASLSLHLQPRIHNSRSLESAIAEPESDARLHTNQQAVPGIWNCLPIPSLKRSGKVLVAHSPSPPSLCAWSRNASIHLHQQIFSDNRCCSILVLPVRRKQALNTGKAIGLHS